MKPVVETVSTAAEMVEPEMEKATRRWRIEKVRRESEKWRVDAIAMGRQTKVYSTSDDASQFTAKILFQKAGKEEGKKRGQIPYFWLQLTTIFLINYLFILF